MLPEAIEGVAYVMVCTRGSGALAAVVVVENAPGLGAFLGPTLVALACLAGPLHEGRQEEWVGARQWAYQVLGLAFPAPVKALVYSWGSI